MLSGLSIGSEDDGAATLRRFALALDASPDLVVMWSLAGAVGDGVCQGGRCGRVPLGGRPRRRG
jgi:hypothetical protein